mgnify:CR=1 FL=1
MTTLHDKVLLITGGASGIGRATVHRCAEKGASVIVADLNLEGAQQVADEVTANGGRARAVAADVSQALADWLADVFGIDQRTLAHRYL